MTDLETVLSEIRKLRQELKVSTKRRLKVDEAAEYLGIAERTLRNRIGPKAKKPFPVHPIRVSGRLVFEVSDLDAYIDGLKEA